MSAIKEIRLYNFKAFFGENIIGLNGKNLLLYGENGSGKSSIYWALYTLLQSVNKENSELNKYFDFTSPENLINKDYLINLDKTLGIGGYDSTVGNNVQIEVELEDGKIFNLSRGGLSARSDRKVLSDLNRYCDFLTHRLLINFYNFRNSQEIDLWPIFMRDIFPFVYEDLDKGKKTIENLILDLRDTKPFKVENEEVIDLSKEEHSKYYKKIRDTNIEIWKWITQISNESNLFFNKYCQNNESIYRIELKYSNSFFYGVQSILIKNNGKSEVVQSARKFLRTPKILLKVYKKSENDWILIDRPQTYLNEALINQIALAIRLSITANRAVKYPGQFLVLDDILMSLDMSNRDKVLDIILDVFAKDYKIYLFTHERSFFNMVKRRLNYSGQMSNWNVKEIYQISDDSGISSPKDFPSKGLFAQALKYKNSRPPDYPASMNYLRKELEEILDSFLPREIFKNDDGSDKKKLNDKIIATKNLFSKLNIDQTHLNQIDDFIFLLLNPLSHNDLESEIYKNDVEKVVDLVAEFRKQCEEINPLIKKIHPRGAQLIMVVRKDSITVNEYLIRTEEDLFVYLNPNGKRTCSPTSINKECICYEVKSSIKGTEYNLKINQKQSNDLQEFYNHTCNKERIAIDPNFLDYYYLPDKSKTINQIIKDI